jgi:alcohol dehydrogenase (NADP+)
MTAVTAYQTTGPRAPFEKTTIERRELAPKDVLIKIAYAGICHSDIHTGRSEWGGCNYPLVPGHEIAGIIEEIGSEVTKFKVGDRAGVGCMVDSCGECEACLEGEEQFCLKGATGTYDSIDKYGEITKGGYSTHIVVDQDFVVHIPEGIGLDVAAPLLCAGITSYSPLKHWKAGPGQAVGVIGLGGLGHMAVKLARALGAEVHVLSHSPGKREEALKLGAHHFHDTSAEGTLDGLKGQLNLIINTVSVTLPIDQYLALLHYNGALVNVGAPEHQIPVSAFSLISGRRTWAGSPIGGIRETQEMLDFCAEHGLGSEIELISASQIDEAWDRVVASDVRYRFVIDTATM